MKAPVTMLKTTDEVRTYEFDFSRQPELVAGATISSVNHLAATPATGITLGSASVSGALVQFLVSGGTDDTTYLINIIVLLSDGSILEEDGYLSIYDRA